MKIPLALILPVAPALLMLAACDSGGSSPASTSPPPSATGSEIRLGMTSDLAGTGKTPYRAITASMQAYFQKVSQEDHGVCGRALTLLAEDDQYNPQLAMDQTKKLVEQDQVLAMIGGLNTPAQLLVAPYLNDPNGDGNTADGVPDLFVSTGWSGWGDAARFPWTIGYVPDYASDGRALGRYIAQALPDKKVGVLYQNDEFGADYLAGLKSGMGRLPVAEEGYLLTDVALSAPMTAIRDAGAEVVVLASALPYTAAAYRAAQSLAFRPQFLMSYVNTASALASDLGGGAQPEQLLAGFKELDGTISTVYLLSTVEDENDAAMKEHRRIMETYQGPPVSSLSVYGQSLGELAVETLSRTCSDLSRPGVLRAAESVRGYSSSLMLPGIQVNLGPNQHRAIETLQLVQIKADGSTAKVGGPISAE